MKLLDVAKEKRINSILYFCQNTKDLSQTKLYKLLFFLDFFHFKEAGRPVTDLEYFAWDKGPVPQKLYFEIKNKTAPPQILKCILPEKDELTGETKAIYFKNLNKPDMSVFSGREKKILEILAFTFRDTLARDMTEITHLKNEPWHKTLTTKGEKAHIDYLLALDKDAKIEKELAEERLHLFNEMRQLFGSENEGHH